MLANVFSRHYTVEINPISWKLDLYSTKGKQLFPKIKWATCQVSKYCHKHFENGRDVWMKVSGFTWAFDFVPLDVHCFTFDEISLILLWSNLSVMSIYYPIFSNLILYPIYVALLGIRLLSQWRGPREYWKLHKRH